MWLQGHQVSKPWLSGVGGEVVGTHCDDQSAGTGQAVDSGDLDTPGPKDGSAIGMVLVLGFGWANGPDEGARCTLCPGQPVRAQTLSNMSR